MPVLAWNFTVFNRALSFFSTLIGVKAEKEPLVPCVCPLCCPPVHPQVVALLVKGSSFPERDEDGASTWGLAKARVCISRRWDKSACPGGEGQRWGWLCMCESSARQLLCSLTLPLSWDLACIAGQVVRGHKEQLTVTAVTLHSLGALDWLTPALHPHGDHRGG